MQTRKKHNPIVNCHSIHFQFIINKGKQVRVNYEGKNIETESPRYDVIEPRGAEVIGNITSLDKDYPTITSNK